MPFKLLSFYVLVGMFLLFVKNDIYALENKQNEVYIEMQSIDYANYIATADLKVNISLGDGNEYAYLILPFKYNSKISFFIEPNSSKNTILTGFMGGNGDFIAQIPLLKKKSDYYFSFKNVQFPINTTSDSDVFGFYNFSNYNIDENISNYKNDLVLINKVHIKDLNLVYTQPNAIQENNQNSLLFELVEETYDITIYVSKHTNNSNIILPIIIGVSAIIIGILSSLGLGLDSRIKTAIKYKTLFKISAIIIIVAQIIFFFLVIYPNRYFNDLTFISTISTLFGVSVGASFVVFFATHKRR